MKRVGSVSRNVTSTFLAVVLVAGLLPAPAGAADAAEATAAASAAAAATAAGITKDATAATSDTTTTIGEATIAEVATAGTTIAGTSPASAVTAITTQTTDAESWEPCGSCEWQIDAETGQLTVRPQNNEETGLLESWDSASEVPWNSSRASIKSVVFEGSIEAQACESMFENCENLTTIDLTNLDADAVTNVSNMFKGCSSLTSLDISGFYSRLMTNMADMLSGCSKLQTLTLPAGIDFSSTGLRNTKWTNSQGTEYANTTEMLAANTAAQGEKETYTGVYVEDGWTQCGTCEWRVDKETGKFTIRPLGGTGTGTLDSWSYWDIPWLDSRTDITSVVIEPGVKAKTCENMFYGCTNLTSVNLSGLDTSDVTSMSSMFGNCSSLSALDISCLDTSAVTNMSEMFLSCTNLTSINLTDVDTSAVTNMSKMFYYCTSLASVDLSDFNTLAVTDISSMFQNCKALVTIYASSVFKVVESASSDKLFEGCISIKGENGTEYSHANTGAARAKIDGGEEDPGYLTDGWTQCGTCEWRINSAGKLTIRPTDGAATGTLDAWGASAAPWASQAASIKSVVIKQGVSAKTCASMFEACTKLVSADLTGLNTSSVKDMNCMFCGCSSLTSVDFGSINTSAVTNMSFMFDGCTSLKTIDLSALETSAVENARYMFRDCSSLTSLDLSSVNLPGEESVTGMLSGCSALETLTLPAKIDFANAGLRDTRWTDSSEITYINTASMLAENAKRSEGAETYTGVFLTDGWTQCGTCEWRIEAETGKLTVRPLAGTGTGILANWEDEASAPWSQQRDLIASAVFEQDVKAQTCEGMFNRCQNLVSVDFSGLDTSAATSMSYMFYGCSSLASINLAGLDTSSVTDMDNMFVSCTKLTSVDLSAINTSAVTNMSLMFCTCSNLTSVDFSGIDTSKVTNMSGMFQECTSLETIDLSGISTSAVTDMSGMFKGNSNLKSVNLSGLDLSKVTTMAYMFDGCSALSSISISDPGTNAITNTLWLFRNCSSLTSLDLTGIDFANVTEMRDMLNGCSKLETITLPAGIDFSSAGLRDTKWTDSKETGYATTPAMFSANFARISGAETYTEGALTDGWEKCGTCQWKVDSEGKLTVCPLEERSTGTLASWEDEASVPWNSQRSSIISVVIEQGVKALTCAYMFADCTGLNAADLTYLDISSVTDMSYMFANCPALTDVPTGFTIPASVNVNNLFYVDSATKIRTHYDGEDESILKYNWADDNRVLVVKCKEGEHKWNEGVITKEPTCTEPGEKTVTCTVCDEVEEGVAVKPIGHKWREWQTITEATCGNAGLKIRTCENDPTHVDTQEIAQLAHDWNTPVILFSADGASATALWTCKNDASHIKAATCEVTRSVEAATCETPEVTTYTATAVAEGMPGGSATTTHTTASALGHTWSNPTIVFAADKASATATWTCATDATHKHTEICTIEKQVKKAATCFEAGETLYVATAAIEGTTAQATDTATEYVSATGHTFNGATCENCKTHLGDVNANGKINTTDAQVAYDIATSSIYKDLESYNALYTAADVTGKDGAPDGYVDAQDAYAILYAAVFGWEQLRNTCAFHVQQISFRKEM